MFKPGNLPWPRLCFVLLLGTWLSACASTPSGEPQPVASPNDKYSYRLVTLDNELEVLLVSAPEAPKAAAALSVMVGSGDNPRGREGLAHFLEHMLFLGTDKYPDAAEYEEYITEHGGTRNAYTSFDHTNYFFDIKAEHLPEALDRFAQFFIAPRFDAQYVGREKQAVEAEYQMGLKSDARRNLDVLQEVMNPAHPYSQFTVGSLETLADREESAVREELLRFYRRHYSANVMRLVVLGNESLDELEALVGPMFAQVPNRSFEPPQVDQPLFAEDALPMFVRAEPLATQRQLELSFPIPDYRHDYRVKPVNYLGNLVGHEGEGSLLSLLKDRGLAESLAAGGSLAWRGGALFSVNIALTEKGVEQHERVLQLVFGYLQMLREKGPREWFYSEQSRLAELRFRFREPGEPISYVMGLANGLHYYAPEDALRGPYMMDRYDREMLAELFARLRADNAMILLNAPGVATDRVSEHYAVPYARESLTVAEVLPEPDDPALAELHLPRPNAFIADDVSLVEHPQPPPAIPQLALQRDRQKIWFMADERFQVPRGAVYINFRSAQAGRTVDQAALAALYSSTLSDSVNELSYPARLAGLHFSLYQHGQGISLKLDGYNDKQFLLLDELLTAIRESSFDTQRFENIRRDMIRALRNAVARRPSSQVMDDLREAIRYGKWGEQALIAALQDIDLERLQTYIERFWRDASAEALVYGNYRPEAVQRLSRALDGVVPSGPAPAPTPVRVLQLAAGESIQLAVEVPHDDSVVAWYLQGRGESWRDRAATALTAQIMKSGFFQQLRTEQQLGYVVSAFNWPQQEVPGLVMLVQSPRRNAVDVAAAIEGYMAGLSGAIDARQFARHRSALVSEILLPHKNLRERADFYWQSIAREQLDFAAREQLADAVAALSLEDWQMYYAEVFMQRRHSLQVVAPGRWGVLPATPGTRTSSASAIKAGHSAYSVR